MFTDEQLTNEQSKSSKMADTSEIITLNVGGQLFDTTRHTLLSINDTFFTVLLSGRIPSYKDKNGALFIDRDPKLFAIILNYLRTNQLFGVSEENIDMMRHEAEFYGIAPLVKKLEAYDNLVNNPTCGGDILFHVSSFVSVFINNDLIYKYLPLHLDNAKGK